LRLLCLSLLLLLLLGRLCSGRRLAGGAGWGRGDAVLGEVGEELWFGKVEAEGFEGDLEFVVVDELVFVEVEEAELLGERDMLESCGGVRGAGMGYCFVYLVALLVR
jgi:hypothetical protein